MNTLLSSSAGSIEIVSIVCSIVLCGGRVCDLCIQLKQRNAPFYPVIWLCDLVSQVWIAKKSKEENLPHSSKILVSGRSADELVRSFSIARGGLKAHPELGAHREAGDGLPLLIYKQKGSIDSLLQARPALLAAQLAAVPSQSNPPNKMKPNRGAKPSSSCRASARMRPRAACAACAGAVCHLA